jgi:DNA-binding Xre family transcriptional regulator
MRKKTKIQELLMDKHMTQSELYDKIASIFETKVTRAMLSNIIKGKQSNYHVNTLIKICIALECTPNELLDSEIYIHLFKSSYLKSIGADGEAVS